MKALRNRDNGLISYGPLINDVSLFTGWFSEFSYSHIWRDGNKVAHNLAMLVMITSKCTWMEDVSSCTLPFCSSLFDCPLILYNGCLLSPKKKKNHPVYVSLFG